MAHPLIIAFTYDSKVDCLARGWTEEQSSAYASTVLLNGVSESLKRLGHQLVDVGHVKNLARRLAAGEARGWDLVFNISEGVFGNAKEVQIPALLEAYKVPYTFSDPACLAVAADKAKTKILLQHHDIPTAPFITVSHYELSRNASNLTTLIEEKLYKAGLTISKISPLFIKPTRISYRSKVSARAELTTMITEVHLKFPRQPLLIEKFANGREFTASIIGSADQAKILGIFELRKKRTAPQHVDFASFEVKGGGTSNFFDIVNVTHEDSDEVREVGLIALAAFRALDCRDLGRIDIRSFGRGSDARPQILEVNCIPGLRPDKSHTPRIAEEEGWTYDQLMTEILSLTIQRYGGLEEVASMKTSRWKEWESSAGG